MPEISSKMETQNIPDSVQAEEWLSADVFLFKGQLWRVKSNGEIAPAEESAR